MIRMGNIICTSLFCGWIIQGVFVVKTPCLYLDLYFYTAVFALRTGDLRSLRRVPPNLPASGLCVSTGSTTNSGRARTLLGDK